MSGNYNHTFHFKPFEYSKGILMDICYPSSKPPQPSIVEYLYRSGVSRGIVRKRSASPYQLLMSDTASEFACLSSEHQNIDDIDFNICMEIIDGEMIPVTFCLSEAGEEYQSVFLSGEYLVSELKLIIAVMSRPTLLSSHLSKTWSYFNDRNNFPLREYIKGLN